MYIEFVIADNFILTFLAGRCACRACGGIKHGWRIAVGAAIGTAVAVCYPLIPSAAGAWVVRIALYAVLSAVMYAKTPSFAAKSLLFLGCTLLFGGASYAVGLLLYANSLRAALFVQKYPLFLSLGCGAAVYGGARLVIKLVRIPRLRGPYTFGVTVRALGSEMRFSAFMDTGNCVFDEKSGLPVIITDIKRFARKLGGDGAVRFAASLPRLDKMRVRTAAGETEIYLFVPDCITVYSDRHAHKINAVIGLVRGGAFSSEHEMLLSPALVTKGECLWA